MTLILCVETQIQTNGCVLTAEQLVNPSTDAQDYLKDVDRTSKDRTLKYLRDIFRLININKMYNTVFAFVFVSVHFFSKQHL